MISGQRLRGGSSSVVHKLTIDRGSETFGVVLKRPVIDDGKPGDPAQEVTEEADILDTEDSED
jgi:hypothetical protein